MKRAWLALTPLLLAATPPQPKKIVLTVDDYPAAATSAGVEGDVVFDLAIDAKGSITGCTIVAGAQLAAGLAADTCRVIQARWRFAPAKDDAGKNTPASLRYTVAWRILARCPPADAATMCVFL